MSFSQGQGKRDVAECKVKYRDLQKDAFGKRTRNATATGNEPPEVLTKNEEAILADHNAEGSHLADGIPGGVESLVSCQPPPFPYKHIPFLCCMCVVFCRCPQKLLCKHLTCVSTWMAMAKEMVGHQHRRSIHRRSLHPKSAALCTTTAMNQAKSNKVS